MTYKILNLTVDKEPFREFDRVKRDYYRKNNVNFSFIYNDCEDYNYVEDKEDIMYRIGLSPDYQHRLNTTYMNDAGIPAMLNKFIAEIKKPEYEEYDYIIRSNSSSFINIANLEKTLNSGVIGPSNYGGWHYDKQFFGMSFMSGTMIVIPKQIISKINSQDVSRYSHHCDDVALGYIIEEMCGGIPVALPSPHECMASDIDYIRHYIDDSLFLRIRADGIARNNQRDIDIWHAIEKLKC